MKNYVFTIIGKQRRNIIFMYVLIFTAFFLRIAYFFTKKLCIFITYSLALQFAKNLLIVWWIECEICSIYVQLASWYRNYTFCLLSWAFNVAVWVVKVPRELYKIRYIYFWSKINTLKGSYCIFFNKGTAKLSKSEKIWLA